MARVGWANGVTTGPLADPPSGVEWNSGQEAKLVISVGHLRELYQSTSKNMSLR